MFALTRQHMPPTEIMHFLDMVIFNVLACNTDAHAKNYSIMIRGNGLSLAPIYDVMCGEVWENVTKDFVQKIGGSNRGEHLKGEHWQLLARECGLNPRQVLERVGKLARSVIEESESAEAAVAAMPAGEHRILHQARQSVDRRAHAILQQLQHPAEASCETLPSEPVLSESLA
jgi:serine/threonine-protein kinase HipA